jgi:lysylphosphatidylglycerol synthetase-like protein (DUF2156 family)
MRGSTAGIALLVICVALAVLAVMKVFTTILTGIFFALAIIVLGLASAGFRKKE